MAKILISGDSWGCGEWGQLDDKTWGVTHLGLEQYLKDDGHHVLNVSIGGINNTGSIKLIEQNLETNWDYIFWIQTDPLRDVIDKSKKFWFADFQDLLKIQRNTLIDAYKKLDNLNCKIQCLGGCSKINLNDIQYYKNLNPIILSIPEFLIPEYSHPLVWFSDNWASKLNENYDLNTLDCIIQQQKSINSLHKISKYFYKDHQHPDREGHYVMFQYIKNRLRL